MAYLLSCSVAFQIFNSPAPLSEFSFLGHTLNDSGKMKVKSFKSVGWYHQEWQAHRLESHLSGKVLAHRGKGLECRSPGTHISAGPTCSLRTEGQRKGILRARWLVREESFGFSERSCQGVEVYTSSRYTRWRVMEETCDVILWPPHACTHTCTHTHLIHMWACTHTCTHKKRTVYSRFSVQGDEGRKKWHMNTFLPLPVSESISEAMPWRSPTWLHRHELSKDNTKGMPNWWGQGH